jgi:hypothetical protein
MPNCQSVWLRGLKTRKDKKMKTYNELKKEAITACNFRGHKMGEWGFTIHAGGMGIRGGSICKKCGKGVQIDTNPPPNGIDIGGEAVSLCCKNLKTTRREER